MTLIGVDLNATRARAVQGTLAGPAMLPLEGVRAELPLALSLEDRTPAIGSAGVSICRRLAHLACLDFLPHLGTARRWSAGRHQLDAAAALNLVFQHLQPRFTRATGIVLTLPDYLSESQILLAEQAAEKARWKLRATTSTALAAALAARESLPWTGQAIQVEVDGNALSFTAVDLGGDQLQRVESRSVPRLGLHAWLRALLDGVARRCVRLSRRDPRASAETEQSLYEQLMAVVAAGGQNGIVELNIQAPQWYQNLMLPGEEFSSFTAPLAEQAAMAFRSFLGKHAARAPVGLVILSSTAGRLPGLQAALESAVAEGEMGSRHAGQSSVEGDFGEGLLPDAPAAHFHQLDDDAVARAAHELAGRIHRGELQAGRLDVVPLPDSAGEPAAEVGPARLHFRGRDHFLRSPLFVLGRDPACDLAFDSALFPSVSARHCEVLRDGPGYLLRDRSRHGTLVNDRPVHDQVALRPGDWIRLGPGGPLLRFLGQAGDPFRLVTTA